MSLPLECAEWAPLVSAYGDGELRCESMRLKVLTHLRSCLACQEILEGNRWLAQAMKATQVSVPPELKDRLLAGLREAMPEE